MPEKEAPHAADGAEHARHALSHTLPERGRHGPCMLDTSNYPQKLLFALQQGHETRWLGLTSRAISTRRACSQFDGRWQRVLDAQQLTNRAPEAAPSSPARLRRPTRHPPPLPPARHGPSGRRPGPRLGLGGSCLLGRGVPRGEHHPCNQQATGGRRRRVWSAGAGRQLVGRSGRELLAVVNGGEAPGRRAAVTKSSLVPNWLFLLFPQHYHASLPPALFPRPHHHHFGAGRV